jgi:hypothetical protein
VTSNDSSVATVSDNENGTYTVSVAGAGGDSYTISITAKGNANYKDSAVYTSAPQTVSDPNKADQPEPGFAGTLPRSYGRSAIIAPMGSLAGAGYTVSSSDTEVATVNDNRDGTFTVIVIGHVGSSYRIHIIAAGNASYNASVTFTSPIQMVVRADQPLPNFTGTLPTAHGATATITPTGSLAHAGYTVTSSDISAATVSDNEDGTYTVAVVGSSGATYTINIVSKGNADYYASATLTSITQTVVKGRQPLPDFEGNLPTTRDGVAVITPTGSLAGAGYEVSSSDLAVAMVLDNEDGSYTVRVVGNVGDSYTLSITALGNSSYNASPTYTSPRQTIHESSQGPVDPALKVSLAKATYDYTGKKIKPVPVVSYNGKALTKGRDYKLTAKYTYNKELGKKIASATYTVAALGESSFGTATQTLKFSIGLKAPVVKKVKRTKKALKVTLKSKVKGAKKYILYYSKHKDKGFKHKTLKLGKKKTLTLKKKLGKKKYYVKVKAYAPKAYKKLIKTKTYKASKAKKLKAKWTKSPYATKYRIAYKLKGTKKWYYKSVKSSKTNYNLKHLKKKKKYSVKIYYQTKAFKSGYSTVKAGK